MMATWFQGTRDEFIKVSQEGYDKGVRILHFLGGMTIDLAGNRAIAQTKMTISQRGPVEGVMCDVVCTGRFYDFLEKRGGKWGLVLRQPIYEKDRLDPVDPSAKLSLDPDMLKLSPKAIATSPICSTDRLQGEARHAGPRRAGSREALRAREELAGRQAALVIPHAALRHLALNAKSAPIRIIVAAIFSRAEPAPISPGPSSAAIAVPANSQPLTRAAISLPNRRWVRARTMGNLHGERGSAADLTPA